MTADEPAARSREGQAARRPLLEHVAGLGAALQAAIPGLYAWGVTVAPAAWSRGAPLGAKAAASVGVLALLTAPFVEARGSNAPRALAGPTWARAWSVWGLVASSAAVWLMVPDALAPARLDPLRGAFGMIGWALFAFASAGPVLQPSAAGGKITRSALRSRAPLRRGDGIVIGLGVALAIALQAVGWAVTVPERAVLVRLVTIICGIAVLGAMTNVALARHRARAHAPARVRVRRALPWIVAAALFVAAALVRSIFS